MHVPIELQDLVVAKIEGPLHLQQAALDAVRRRVPARLAPHKMRHERPLLVAGAGFVGFHELFVAVHDDDPVAVEVVGILQEDLGRPFLGLGDEQVREHRLVVGVEHWSVGEHLAELLADLDGDPRVAHGRPGVQHVERPLAVAHEE